MKQTRETRLERLEQRHSTALGNRTELCKLFDEMARQFNSPEAKAQREAIYQERELISEYRRRASIIGKPMSTYPLPGEDGYTPGYIYELQEE